MDYHAGIDVSLEASSVCVVDASGKIIREAKVLSEPENLIGWFRDLGFEMTRIGLEAGPLSQWLYAAMKKEVGGGIAGVEKMKNDTIGVDVSKDHLDAHRLADGATRRFANNKGGHKALIKWLADTPLYRVVFEPTGPYHRAVERALGASGVPFVKVNPRQARRFAEATGKLAKTDRLDAAILARMGALLELEARPARSEVLLELKELYVAREALVKDRTAAKNRGKALTLSLLKRQNARRLEQIDRQMATVEAAILQIVEADASLADRACPSPQRNGAPDAD